MEKLQAEAGNIALVLLDINMPVMNGFEVLKAMNANHTIEDTPGHYDLQRGLRRCDSEVLRTGRK